MRSARALTVSPSMLGGGGEAGSDPPQFPPLGVGLDLIPSISPLGMGLDLIPLNLPLGCGPGGRGCLLLGGGSLLGRGNLLRGGVVVVSQHALRQTHPWTESQTPVKTLPRPKLKFEFFVLD